MVTSLRTASLWHLLLWCISNFTVASFKLVSPLTMNASSALDDHCNFFSHLAQKHVKHTTESFVSK